MIGAVPMAEEVYPLGGRAGETVGLELRGGTLRGVKIAAATLNPPFGTDLVAPRISSAMLGLGVSTGAPSLDVESLAPLVVSTYPEIRETADPAAPPLRAVAPVVLNGRIDPPGDDDRFVLAVTPGQRLRIKVQAYEHGSALDGVLRVLGNGGSVLANADDTNIPLPPKNGQQPQSLVLPDPSLDFTIPGGTNEITLVMRDLENRGGIGFPYRIVVEPLFPDFQLLVNESQVSVPRGGTAAVGVTVQRKGYSGPITVTVADPPRGLDRAPGIDRRRPDRRRALAVGGRRRQVSRRSDQARRPRPGSRTARSNGSHSSRSCTPSRRHLPTCSITEYGLVAAPALAHAGHARHALCPDRGRSRLERDHSGQGDAQPRDPTRALAILTLPLPPGLTDRQRDDRRKSGGGKGHGQTAVTGRALGTMTVGLQAKGKFAGAERTFALPAVTLAVVPPATVELAAPGLEIKPGATGRAQGKNRPQRSLRRARDRQDQRPARGLESRAGHRAGRSAPSFVVKIVADAKAAAASAGSPGRDRLSRSRRKTIRFRPRRWRSKCLPIK